MIEEVWKDYPEFPENIIVSNTGRIKTKERVVIYRNGRTRKYKSHELSQTADKQGYLSVCITIGNKTYRRRVHRLVALTFLNNTTSKPEVNHLDGDKSNNSVENLEWVTRKENVEHALETKLFIPAKNFSNIKISGENNPSAKLSDEDVDKIRKMRKSGAKLRELSEIFGVSVPYLSLLCNQKYR